MKAIFSFNTLFMIFAMVVAVAALTWIIPGGEYKRELVGDKTLVIAGTFAGVESQPQGLGAVLTAPLKGFMESAKIIGFCFIIGGIFTIIQNTGAVRPMFFPGDKVAGGVVSARDHHVLRS
ncbi:hypothetical protein HGA89_06180, partial [bacterium]|nr:hypothetical protein [bacterium]